MDNRFEESHLEGMFAPILKELERSGTSQYITQVIRTESVKLSWRYSSEFNLNLVS